jgi:bifunctional UDP-N-acetylglucosamine pyrophosphorylase/glucosamine-1-phosphate N-acetyltransferase
LPYWQCSGNKNSIIGNNTNVAHLSYVGDSIIGDDCNLGAGTIIANLRHDHETIKTKIKGKMIDTKREKLGAIIGDNVKTGIGTLIYPGRKIWPQKTTLPGQKVEQDIE